MKVKKKLVENNFSRRSSIYDESAVFQQYAANKLFEQILKSLGDKKPRRVLELGCGTGFLTGKLLEAFPEAHFEICDISQKMIDKCQENTSDIINRMSGAVSFYCGDLDLVFKGRGKGEFDLIVSALAFQWIEKLAPVIRSTHKSLSDASWLVFSTLADGTYKELRSVFDAMNEKYPGPDFLNLEELSDMCADFAEVSIVAENYEDCFDSALDFLRQVQRTGAGNATGKPVSPKILRKVINSYPANEDGKVSTSYDLIICAAEKLES